MNQNPIKEFEGYQNKINKETIYKGLKNRTRLWFSRKIEKIAKWMTIVFFIGYIFAIAYILIHFFFEFW